ncbi:hypothetical protein FA13DRAFT_1797750 [Coprinellus micaceus]|uniref:Transmembrane protein 135 N-terminal domain-containing protein n=1 Tax=Coprinellus micaceus TaxID=71717 RepID=A0A4Y7SPC4_COPMI|nr:hypothetical protein FA13DRAFT_1797750 [Coprinellus micaceus]
MHQDSDDTTPTPMMPNNSSTPPTPAHERNPEYDGPLEFRPKRAMASFENLVAMANYQEALKEARKMVWRDKGQPVVELDTLRQCLEHSVKGGLRSGGLAFSIRALVNLVLALLRIGNVPKMHRPALIRHALFGEDTWRFGAMLGIFTSLYKFLINALPILIPALKLDGKSYLDDDLDTPLPLTVPSLSATEEGLRRRRVSLTHRAQMVLVRKRVKRWYAALAGAVAGGMAIMCEKRNRRGVISQQMFVRGLQGSYNAFAAARNFSIPYGDVIVFSLCCGQIMYGWLLRRDTLPKSYTSWITTASKLPAEAPKINHDLLRYHKYNPKDFSNIFRKWDTHPSNHTHILDFMDRFDALPPVPPGQSPYEYLPPVISSLTEPITTAAGKVISPTDPASWYLPYYVDCRAVHPGMSSCTLTFVDKFFTVGKWILPIYGGLHFVPAILFKLDAFKRDPGKVIVKAGLGSLRSSAFLGVFVALYNILFCYKHRLHRFLTILRSTSPALAALLSQRLIDALFISKPAFWLTGVGAGLSLLVEAKRRRGELAMYVLPKGMESAWLMARGKGYVFKTGKWGDVILTAMGMGMVMSTYQNDPQHLSGLVRRVLYQFIGPN